MAVITSPPPFELPDGFKKRIIAEGSTGMQPHPSKCRPASIDEVLDFLRTDKVVKSGYNYKPGIWDCEDLAFWGMAHARCRFPGLPVGAAIGPKTGGKFAGKDHAVIVIWFKDGNKWELKWFDPQDENFDRKDFKTWIVVPFPRYSKYDGIKKPEKTPKFENLVKAPTGALILDRNEDYKIGKYDEIKGFLLDIKRNKRCFGFYKEYSKKFDYTEDSARADFKKYRTPQDTAFLAFNQARKEYPGQAIGVAFGRSYISEKNKYKEDARVVLWKNWVAKPSYIDINKVDLPFTPEIIIV